MKRVATKSICNWLVALLTCAQKPHMTIVEHILISAP
jgi:hypothetical protein